MNSAAKRISPEPRRTSGSTYRVQLDSASHVQDWRLKARQLLLANVAPEDIFWAVDSQEASIELNLFDEQRLPAPFKETVSSDVRIAKDLLQLINSALLHSAEDRFHIAYRLIFRAKAQPGIHRNPADKDVRKLQDYAKSVRRDIHKMHAFVRFRKAGEAGNGREQFVAWFEPDHHIVDAVAPFFRNRFNGMDWIIMTPDRSIGWDGKKLSYGPGGRKSDLPKEDRLEEEWRAYYANIFNPARVKIAAMKSEMPMKYWKNLPEAELIAPLTHRASDRVDAMIESDPANMVPNPVHNQVDQRQFSSLANLYNALDQATYPQSRGISNIVVRGEGPSNASVMLVGEQPGDEEDKQGRLFVGPAGQMLDRAMVAAKIERNRLYLSNAVKRFKYVVRGKRRLHQNPSVADIDHYRWWLEQEIALVRPRLIVALGATAARSLLKKPVTISRVRNTVMPYRSGIKMLVTVHPAYLLRLPDEDGRQIEYQKFVRDLELAAGF